MGSCFSSTLTSYRRIFSSNSFRNTTELPISQPSLSSEASAEPAGLVDTTTNGSVDIESVNPPTTTSDGATYSTRDNPPQGDSARITQLMQPRSLAVVAASFTLLINPPKSKPKHNVSLLNNAYILFLCLSCFTSIGSLLFISESTEWIQKQAMRIAIVSIVASVTLRVALGVSAPVLSYNVLINIVVVGGVLLYFLYGWIKAKNSTQTANSGLTPTNEV